MKKRETVGVIGENIVKEILSESNIDYLDLTSISLRNETVNVNSINRRGKHINYTYTRKSQKHPHDLIIANKNVEIKTSTEINGYFNVSLAKNDLDVIDFIIVVVLSAEKTLLHFHILEKNDFVNRRGIKRKTKDLKKLLTGDLLKTINYIVI